MTSNSLRGLLVAMTVGLASVERNGKHAFHRSLETYCKCTKLDIAFARASNVKEDRTEKLIITLTNTTSSIERPSGERQDALTQKDSFFPLRFARLFSPGR